MLPPLPVLLPLLFADPSPSEETPWIHRYKPPAWSAEAGVFGGIILPSTELELFEADPSLPAQGHQPLKRIAPELGLRGGFYPLRHFGVEAELAVMPAKLDTAGGERATLFAGRGHVVGQIGKWSVVPFALLGAGTFGVGSDRAALGTEVDAAIHWGVGAKFQLTRAHQLRFDVRDTISSSRGVDTGVTNTWEVLLGYTIVFGPKEKNEPRREPEPGPGDRDGDGFLDPDDTCPDTPGVEPDGCPIPDTDGDGILDPDDACVEEPENKNNYKDADGCPDELPEEVEAFGGVLQCITFDVVKDTIRRSSQVALRKALKVLRDYPQVRVEIVGHTDSDGGVDHNHDLATRRANAVKAWLVRHGIDKSRIETRGAGQDEPIASNDTPEGKAKNRRIEFIILEGGT